MNESGQIREKAFPAVGQDISIQKDLSSFRGEVFVEEEK
jgi:hypothetical protein